MPYRIRLSQTSLTHAICSPQCRTCGRSIRGPSSRSRCTSPSFGTGSCRTYRTSDTPCVSKARPPALCASETRTKGRRCARGPAAAHAGVCATFASLGRFQVSSWLATLSPCTRTGTALRPPAPPLLVLPALSAGGRASARVRVRVGVGVSVLQQCLCLCVRACVHACVQACVVCVCVCASV